MSNEKQKTYRSYGVTTLSDNLIVSFNVRFIINCIIAFSIFGWTVFTYEQRLREAESAIIEHSKRLDDLKSIHDAEIEEIQAWYKKSLEVDLNPLNILKRKRK